jgi:hypothetical protein
MKEFQPKKFCPKLFEAKPFAPRQFRLLTLAEATEKAALEAQAQHDAEEIGRPNKARTHAIASLPILALV